MKTFSLILLNLSMLFVSCGHYHVVKLKNGSKVNVSFNADVVDDIRHLPGDSVCIRYHMTTNFWDGVAGEMVDTTYTFTAKLENETERTIFVEKRIGVIVK